MGDRNPRLVASPATDPSAPGLSFEERAAALASGIPAAWKTNVFAVADPCFAEVFDGDSSLVLDTSEVAAGVADEVSWWAATCHASRWRQIDVCAFKECLSLAGALGVPSFATLDQSEWEHRFAARFYAERGQMPGVRVRRNMLGALGPLLSALAVHYSPLEWWRHDVWDPALDSRIPRRPHEPRASNTIGFASLSPAWLVDGLKFYLAMQLETGRWVWTSAIAHRRLVEYGLSDYLEKAAIDHPALCVDPKALRALALDLSSFIRTRPPRGRARSKPSLAAETLSRELEAVSQFYAFMADYRDEAAVALGDERWRCLTDAHARLFRPAEIARRGRAVPAADDSSYICDADLSCMFSRIELLGVARTEKRSVILDGETLTLSGLGDPSVMRAWILQALTGRRASEILMMDFEPIIAVPGLDPKNAKDGAMVARLAYRQTKIDGAPTTILVGADVVAVVAEQQAWVRERFGLGDGESAPYLFPHLSNNPRGTRARPLVSYLQRLGELDKVLCLKDTEGRPLSYSRSHRLRHTKATTLLNAGAPIHVVMRYLGHRSPEMVMRYAATLATTAEREFLALAKIGRDGREIPMERQDLLDLVALERRADRVLPNGYCLLPPTKSCEKGNACHTCDHFATDRTYLPEIVRQLAETEMLVTNRQARHLARHGEEMSEANVWLAQRRTEISAMRLEINALEALDEHADGSVLRGPGVLARPGYSARSTSATVQLTPKMR